MHEPSLAHYFEFELNNIMEAKVKIFHTREIQKEIKNLDDRLDASRSEPGIKSLTYTDTHNLLNKRYNLETELKRTQSRVD